MKTPPSRTPRNRSLRGFWLLGMALPATTLWSATVSGTVREKGTNKPLVAVEVVARSMTGSPLGSTLTDDTGAYTFTGMPAGNVEIVVSVVGYLLNPSKQTCKVEEPAKTADPLLLFPRAPDAQVLRAVAQTIVQKANGHPEAAERAWDEFRKLPILYSAKTELAQAVVQDDPRLGSAPTYATFKPLDVTKIKAFETQLIELKNGKGLAVKVPPELAPETSRAVADAAVKSTSEHERGNFQAAVKLALPGMF